MTSVSNLSWRIAVWSTRIWIAGIFNFNWLNDKRWLTTRCEGVSNISLYADTVGNMIDHLTLGIDSTIGCWTWVNTMQVLTCFVGWAFCIGCTFRSAGNIRVSKVVWDALTRSRPSSGGANCVTTTRRRIARIHSLSYRRS